MREHKCWDCAYRDTIAGNTHINCMRSFSDGEFPKVEVTRWSRFWPYNFDPTWVSKCDGWAESRDPDKTREKDPLLEVFSILGGAGRL